MSFRDGIEFASLPKNFRDAIEFCKDFGLRYIWIDSLCIIQDSPDDWREQSNTMGEVYRNSTLCLSASGARDANEGLYFDRATDDIGSFPLCPAFQSYDWRVDSANPPNISWHIVYQRFGSNLFRTTTTLNRGWIFQERFLSNRILNFSKRQIFWECCTAIYCETFPNGLPRPVVASTEVLTKAVYEKICTKPPSLVIDHPLISDLEGRCAAAQMQITWETVVANYTRCKLTKSDDKLVALSGMAQNVWLNWKDKIDTHVYYVAGIWNIQLPHGLLWKTSSTNSRPPVYRAPTWSWSSIEGTIDFQSQHWHHAYEYTATILDIHTEYVKSSWGQVKAGHLLLKAPIRRIKCVRSDINQDYALRDQEQKLPIHDDPSGHGIMIKPDEKTRKRTETWGDLHALLVMRFLDPAVKSRCIIVLNPLIDREDTFNRVGIMAPMTGQEVAQWFDGVAERAIKIL
jgi:hypothetical protein